jgi:gliding motility-associated-like protein
LNRFLNKAYRYLIISFITVFFPVIPVSSQKVINEYTRITEIFNKVPTNIDSVKVNDSHLFEEGDTVLFIVIKGATIYAPWNIPDTNSWGTAYNWGNIGRYNVLLVYDVDTANDIVIFSTKLRDLYPSRPGEIAQLVKVRGGQDVYTVNEPLTCKAWDPADSTGGVFVLMAGRKIVLNSTIDVSGKGFLGGDPDSPSVDYFTGGCSEAAGFFYTESAADSAGRKGESAVYEGFPFTRGMRFVLHGGGGGNGKYSGGGGGGNWGKGGSGGSESASCSPTANLGGSGSGISFFYRNNDAEYGNRIFMGGGGGTATQNPGSDRYATKGGNGGGIIILITDTIEATGSQVVRTRGESVTDAATAGAGGGGGGGVIILEATKFLGNPTFDIKGGDGGKTDHADPTGPGGSGGGGVIWHYGGSLTGVTTVISAGATGIHIPTGLPRSNTSGTNGFIMSNLSIPLSGFLFNVMPEDQDICQGNKPSKFFASTPKGGDGPGTYTYRWIQGVDTIIEGNDTIIWNDAPGTDYDKKDYQSGPLFDTIHFRRIVNSGGPTGTYDTSLILTINILDSLEHNDIASDDIICFGSVIPDIKDDPVFNITGGNGKYKYSWLSSTNMTNWNTLTGSNDSILKDEIPLDTTYYRRIVNSHVCWDTSNIVTITVLPGISDNDIFSGALVFPDDTICENDNAQLITGTGPGGGDGDYRYTWQSSLNNLSWNPTIPSNGQNFDPGVLTNTIYYRRIVISGSDDECKDTSNMMTVLMHPLITNNLIARDTIICMDDPDLQLKQLSGSTGGGDGIYKYYWQSRAQSGSWQAAGNADTLAGFEPGYIQDTILYRRYIASGACDTFSNEIEVIVQDSIMNNLIADDDTICRDAIPVPVTGTSPAGGDIEFSLPVYQWESSLNNTTWVIVSGANQQGYQPPSLSDTIHYRRRVTSGKCIHFSDPVVIIVQAPIINNAIQNGLVDSTCYETTLDMDGTAGIFEMTGGDMVNYSYGWQKSIDDQDWSPAPGINNLADYTTEELMLPVYYRRFVTSGACSNTTTPPTYVFINPRPTAWILGSSYLTDCYDSHAGPVEVSIPYTLTGADPFRIVSFDGFENDTIDNIRETTGNLTDYLTTANTNDFNIEIVELRDGNGCLAYPDSLTGMVTMTVYKRPEINIGGGDDPQQVCNDLIQLTASQDVGTGYWIKAVGDEDLTINDPEQLSVQVSTRHGSGYSKYYQLYRTGKNWPVPEEDRCVSRDSVEVIFWKEPEPAYAGSKVGAEFDTVIYFADYMYMNANPPTAGTGEWTISSGSADIENDTLYNTRVDLGNQNLDEPTDYTFIWTVNNGICPVTSDDITVARRDLRIYESFSPDGNSINEFFTIEGLEYADTWDLKIFSRSGNLIKQITKGLDETGLEADELWDGTYDGGRHVESGIYYYILEVTKGDHAPYQYKGFVVIARERQ